MGEGCTDFLLGENIVFLKGFHEWVKGVQTFCVSF